MRKGIIAGFRERLEEVIIDSNLDLNDFCYKAGITRNMLWSWRFNNTYPAPINLLEICKAFKVSSDWLLGLSDIKEPKSYKPVHIYKKDEKAESILIEKWKMNSKGRGLAEWAFDAGRDSGIDEMQETADHLLWEYDGSTYNDLQESFVEAARELKEQEE